MNRRTYLGAVAGAGVAATAGCSAIGGTTTLSDPAVLTESPGRRALEWRTDDGRLCTFGVDGRVSNGTVDLPSELSHREGTAVRKIRLRFWMPAVAGESPARVAVVSPVEGDSSPPPSLSLSTPERELGTVVEVDDLDDLADETISTLGFVIDPGAERATALAIDVRIDLKETGLLGAEYTVEGRLDLEYPGLASR